MSRSKHKAAVTKYKSRLNDTEARLKQTKSGLVEAKQETSSKLSAIEDEVSWQPIFGSYVMLAT